MPNTKQTERKAVKRPAPAYVDDPGTGAGPDEPEDVEPNNPAKETPIEDLTCFLCGKSYEYRTNVLRHLYSSHGVDADGRILPPAKQEAARKRSRKQPTTKPTPASQPAPPPAPRPQPEDAIEVLESSSSSPASSTRSRRMTEIERLGLAMGGSADSSFDLRDGHSPTPPMHEVLALLQPTATTEAVSEMTIDQPPPAPLIPTIVVVNAPPAPVPVSAPAPVPASTSTVTPAPVVVEKPTKPVTDKPAEKPSTSKSRHDKSQKPVESTTAAPTSKHQKPSEESLTASQHVRRIAGSMTPTAPTMSTRSRPAEARTKETTTTTSTAPKPAGDPTVRRPTNPAPVHTPASRPEQTLPEVVRPVAKKPPTVPGRVLSPSTLYFQLERHPHESVDQLATRLGSRYGWTDDERQQHRSRLLDIKTAQDLNAIDNRKRAPLCRDPATLDAYFKAVAERADYALLDLDELEDLYVDK